jgi:hypothetical protein
MDGATRHGKETQPCCLDSSARCYFRCYSARNPDDFSANKKARIALFDVPFQTWAVHGLNM